MAKIILKEELENLEKNFLEKYDRMNEKSTLKNFDEITRKTIEFFNQLKNIVRNFHKLKQSQFKDDHLNLPIYDCFCSTVYTNVSIAMKSLERNLTQFSTMKELQDRLEIKNMKTIENKSLPIQFMNNKNDHWNSICTPNSFNNPVRVDLKHNKSVRFPNEPFNQKENVNFNQNKNNIIFVQGNNGPFQKPNPVSQNHSFSKTINNRVTVKNENSPLVHSNSMPNEKIPNKSEKEENIGKRENQDNDETYENQEKVKDSIEYNDNYITHLEEIKKIENIEKTYDEKIEELINDHTHYKFIKLISRGGFANVYECIKGNEKFALKIIKSEKSEENLKGYELEREMLSDESLKHPNIIKMIKYINEHKIYVLEYVEYSMRKLFFLNKEYKELLRDQEIVFLIIAQIARALEHLYDNKYCHRDIKLDNILINTDTFQVKLIDFNTAKYITEKDPTCTIIDSGPTSNYSILEKNCGRKETFEKTDQIFHKDIYSLGVIIYSLVTQQLVDDKFNYIFALYSNNDIIFEEIMKLIFTIKDFTIKNFIQSHWYISMHKCFESEIEELNKEFNTKIEDPYSIMLKKRIDAKMKKDDDFYVDF